ncbi:hypothetical protein [Rhodococcus sp. SJ-2]
MPTAVMVADNVGGFPGPATLYRIDPPLKGTDHLMLFYQSPMFGQDGQLVVLLATQYGAVFGADVRPQPGTHVTSDPNHPLALQLAGGYSLLEEEVVPDAEQVESSQLYDPSAHTVDEVNTYLATADPAERARVLEAERNGKARKGILGDEGAD